MAPTSSKGTLTREALATSPKATKPPMSARASRAGASDTHAATAAAAQVQDARRPLGASKWTIGTNVGMEASRLDGCSHLTTPDRRIR